MVFAMSRQQTRRVDGRSWTGMRPLPRRDQRESCAQDFVERMHEGDGRMRFAGRIWKDGKFWLAEVPMLNAMTQGRSPRGARPLLVHLILTICDHPPLHLPSFPSPPSPFQIT